MKKDSRGFTLIEMMAVVIILGILLMIAVPAVNKYLANVRLEYYQKLEDSVKTAGEEYTQDKRYIRPTKLLYSTVVKIDKLEDGKYIDEVKDYLGNKCDNTDTSYSYVVVVKSGEQSYEYQTCLKCSEDEYVTDTSTKEMDLCNPAWLTNDRIEYTKPAEMGEIYAYYSTNQDDFKSQVGITYDVIKKDSAGNVLAKVENPGGDEDNIIYPDNIGSLVGQNAGSTITLQYTLPDGSKITRKAYIYKHNAPIIKITYGDNNIINGRKTGESYNNGEWSHSLKVEAKFSDLDIKEIFTKGGIQFKGLEYFDNATNEWNNTSCFVNANKLECVWTIESNFNKDKLRFRIVNNKGQVSDATSEDRLYSIKVDGEAPTCGSISGDSTTWINKTRTVSIACNDKGDSKCNRASYSLTYPTATEKNKRIGSLTIYDNAGNSTSCSANVYVDTTNPSSCTLTMKENSGAIVSSGSTKNTNVKLEVNGEDRETDASGIGRRVADAVGRNGNNYTGVTETTDFNNDTYTITPVCTDVAGNTTRGQPSTLTLDKSILITYDANTGTGNMADTVCKYNQDCQIATNTFNKPYYKIISWNTQANGKGTTYALNAKVKLTKDIKLYAQWQLNTIDITFNPNGGSGGTKNIKATYGDKMPAITLPTRVGYTFQGYFDTSATSGGTQYYNASGGSARNWDRLTPTTLYARWKANTYKITYYGNGSNSGATQTQNCTYDQNCTIKTNWFKRTGYTFIKWTTAANGSGSSYTNNQVFKYTLTNNMSLYANWAENCASANTYDEYSAWGAYGTCSKNCDSGLKYRYRTHYKKSKYTNEVCSQTTESQSASCNTQSCCSSKYISRYSNWSTSGGCSVGCGWGTQSIYRTRYYSSNYDSSVSCGSDTEWSSQSCYPGECCGVDNSYSRYCGYYWNIYGQSNTYVCKNSNGSDCYSSTDSRCRAIGRYSTYKSIKYCW